MEWMNPSGYAMTQGRIPIVAGITDVHLCYVLLWCIFQEHDRKTYFWWWDKKWMKMEINYAPFTCTWYFSRRLAKAWIYTLSLSRQFYMIFFFYDFWIGLWREIASQIIYVTLGSFFKLRHGVHVHSYCKTM